MQLNFFVNSFFTSFCWPCLRQYRNYTQVHTYNVASELQADIELQMETEILDKRLKINTMQVIFCIKNQFDDIFKNMKHFLIEPSSKNNIDNKYFIIRQIYGLDQLKMNRIIRDIKLCKPYVRTKQFKKNIVFIILVIGFLNTVGIFSFFTSSISNVFRLQAQHLSDLGMDLSSCSCNNTLNCYMIFVSAYLSLAFLSWLYLYVLPSQIEINYWAKEVAENIQISLQACQFFTANNVRNKKGEEIQFLSKLLKDEHGNRRFVPYFSMNSSNKSQIQFDFMMKMNQHEKLTFFYATYLNFRLLSQFLKQESRVLKTVLESVIDAYTIGLIAIYSTKTSDMNNSAFVSFLIVLVVSVTTCQVQMFLIHLFDDEVSCN